MELTWAALSETQRAFDSVAATYDEANTANPILAGMRARTLVLIRSSLPPGSRLLDLGCGPGSDAMALARQGYRITAIDWSEAMAAEAADRVAREGLGSQVVVRSIGIHELDWLEAGAFDGAYSNFGPLNCVPNLAEAACTIAERVKPGGVLVASVIGRVCPWEIGRYLLAGDWRRARIRFTRDFVGVPLEGRTVWMRYYAPAEFAGVFAAAGWQTASLSAMGLFTPPPYLQAFHGRHGRLMRVLDVIESHAAGWPGVRQWGDHFLISMVRR